VKARLQQDLGNLGAQAEAGMFVPLRFRNRTAGVLVALDRGIDGPAFTAEDQRLAESFATSAATAVATAQTVATERLSQRLAAAESERRRWARELHDDTLQGLGALKVALGSARRAGSREVLERAVDDAIEHLGTEIDNLRGLITDLRPAALDELGAEAAIQALVDRVRRSGLEVDVEIDLAYESGRADIRHAPEVEAAMYRIVQEALTNAVKHAEAERALITIVEYDEHVEIRVRDDGKGFDPSVRGAGFGLLGMRERVELLDGSLSVETESGKGSVIQANLPVTRTGTQGSGLAATPRAHTA
jgi:signal transduction histidine kinase